MNAFNPQNILCPIDFSDLSNLALKYAVVGSREYGAKLTAREEKEDLIVLGAYHRIFQGANALGKTTDLVVRHATVPVLVIPAFP